MTYCSIFLGIIFNVYMYNGSIAQNNQMNAVQFV